MGFYDELDKQMAADTLNTQLDDAMEMYEEKFGESPMIPIEMSFSLKKLIESLKQAVESDAPGIFKS